MSLRRKCLFCGKEFKATRQQVMNGYGKFCSHSCSMRAKVEDVSGQRYGNLTILRRIDGERCLCRCDCGKETIAFLGNMRKHHTKSCGCLRHRTKTNLIHGLCKTRLHQIWWAMKQRTTDKNSQAYRNYGGRGIKLCKEWFDFVPFYDWAISNGYSDTLSIDRINNNKGYYPDNCRWVDMKIQNRNKRTNVYYMLNGTRMTLSDVLKNTGYSETSYYRNKKKNKTNIKKIFRGMDFDKYKIDFCRCLDF